MTLDICFFPGQGQKIFAPWKTVALFAIASRLDAQIEATLSDGSTATLNLIGVPSMGGGYHAFTTTVEIGKEPLTVRYSYVSDGEKTNVEGHVTIIPKLSQATEEEFTTVIRLEEQEDFVSVKIPWLKLDNWQGWVWLRHKATWIESRWMTLRDLPGLCSAHCLLLQPVNSSIDPSSTFCVFPCSSAKATVSLSAARDVEEPGVYARVRRVKPGGTAEVYVVGKTTTNADPFNSLDGAIGIAKRCLGTTNIPYVFPPSEDRGTVWPFEELGFCTWESIGENIRPTRVKLEKLMQSLKRAQIPIGSFIIDDGWQDIRSEKNETATTRQLWSLDVWDGMDATFKDTVAIIKEGLSTVENVGVWMTLQGYWNSIASQSSLIAKYKMRPFGLSRDCVPGIACNGFDEMQTLVQPDEKNHVWWLPPKEFAYQFWRDYFTVCADAGITFAKVDNQSFSSFLAGVEGAEEAFVLWDNMNKAADDIFGQGRVIHCMAHCERTFNGDIAMGMATHGTKVVFRNSDDFGLPRPKNAHRDHIRANLMNCIITSRMCLIPDADMFMSAAQWPEYHAVLRAFFPGPIILSDEAEDHDLKVIHKLIARTTRGHYELVKSHNPALPLRSRIWEQSIGPGIGPSIKATSYFSPSKSSAVIMWSSRDDALHSSTDIILSSDVVDVIEQHVLRDTRYVLWFANTKDAVFFGSAIDPRSVFPLAEVTLAPKTHEVITVAPLYKLGDIEIACLGLVDKYAGLAAIAAAELIGTTLKLSILFEGELGFVVTDASHIKIYVNDELVTFTAIDLNESAVLLKLQLISNSPALSKLDHWPVDVLLAE
ncbi:glycoside hydrolase superfamily [Lipomyces kononenkoae]|uniref:Glycoside hydrolase superfamily n=1 Tax=Lipomyces kononenkoae TaxID=34357 RepID=A0ACC3T1U1_LIPKO